MKKNLLINLFALMALMYFGSINAQSFNVMLVTGNTEDVELSDGNFIDDRDSLLYETIIGGNLGWTVTLVADDSTDVNSPTVTTAIQNSDVILISSSVSSGNVVDNTEIMEGNLPIISLEYGTWDNQLLYYGDQNDLELDDPILSIDQAPEAAYGDLGLDIVFMDTTVETAKARFLLKDHVLASGAEVWGTVMMRDTAYPTYVYAPSGAQLISPETGADTSVTRNYDQMMFGLLEPASAHQLTDAGWELLERALCYLVGVEHPLDDDTGIFQTKSVKQPFYFAKNALHFQLDQNVPKTEIQIFSITGQLLLQDQVNPNEVLELSHLRTGLYIVKGPGFADKILVE